MLSALSVLSQELQEKPFFAGIDFGHASLTNSLSSERPKLAYSLHLGYQNTFIQKEKSSSYIAASIAYKHFGGNGELSFVEPFGTLHSDSNINSLQLGVAIGHQIGKFSTEIGIAILRHLHKEETWTIAIDQRELIDFFTVDFQNIPDFSEMAHLRIAYNVTPTTKLSTGFDFVYLRSVTNPLSSVFREYYGLVYHVGVRRFFSIEGIK